MKKLFNFKKQILQLSDNKIDIKYLLFFIFIRIVIFVISLPNMFQDLIVGLIVVWITKKLLHIFNKEISFYKILNIFFS